MSAAVIAYGAASALGVGKSAFDVGAAGQGAKSAWSERRAGKPFGRVLALDAPHAARPQALLELGLRQITRQLDALDDAWRTERLGVVIGTSSGGFAALERALAGGTAAVDADWQKSAYFAPLSAALPTLGTTPRRLVSLYAACASSTLALGLGLRWLELGEVDLVIAGGYDAESDWVCAGFDVLKATSTGVPRPFRAERDGMALGEGVALVALRRQATSAYGFIQGFAASTDAVHITAPDRTGKALARAALGALEDAQIKPESVDFVSVHGTGTSFNDAAEAAALRTIFGERAFDLCLHAFKPSVGHTLGAAGALEALSALSALSSSVLPASASAGKPMPELPARLLDQNTPSAVEHCLKLSTAFGGANAALVLSRGASSKAARPVRPVYVVAAGEPCTSLEPSRLEGLLVAPPERLPRSDALSSLVVAASAEALRAAARAGVVLERERTGVIVGSVSASLEANADYAARIVAHGVEHAEPRRFPATSPNACAGHAAIAFALGGPSHAVGAGPLAAFEALQVARDWIAAGDADALLVVAAEQAGPTSGQALSGLGLKPPPAGAFAVLLSSTELGPLLVEAHFVKALELAEDPKNGDWGGLPAWARAIGLPGGGAFGSVPPPE
jgi:3-oxoacyl-[acyl-carrier-protein] synthase II